MRTTLCVLILIGFGTSSSVAGECPSAPPSAGSDIVIKLGESKIKLAELDGSISKELCAAKMAYDIKVNELRQNAAEALLMERLVRDEVKSRGMANEQELITKEVITKVKAPTESEIKAFYNEVQERLGGKSLEQVRSDLVGYLREQGIKEAYQKFSSDLRAKAKVKLTLPVYRLPVSTSGPSKGPKDAKVVIVEYADYECPYCGRAGETLKAVMKKYPKDVRVVFKDYPLDFHENALPAAVGARCAGQQGKFWEMHEALFANMSELGPQKIRELAGSLALDSKKFEACLVDPSIAQAVQADQAEGARFGVEGTPAFFVNGVPLSGAQPIDAFIPIIERELAR